MVRRISYTVLLFILFIIASLNMFFSQQFPPLMYDVVSGHNSTSIVTFLRTIRGEDFFPQQLAYYKELYGPAVEGAVYQDTADSLNYTKKLEAFVQEHPKSRDILVRLALFYEKRGDDVKAQGYYNRAKKIDPWLHIAFLEK